MSATVSSTVAVFDVIYNYVCHLVVRLVVESIKTLAVVTIVVGSITAVCLLIVTVVFWLYIYFDRSLLTLIAGIVVALPLLVFTWWAVEYLVKDVLCLTPFTLAQLIQLILLGNFEQPKNLSVRRRSDDVLNQSHSLSYFLDAKCEHARGGQRGAKYGQGRARGVSKKRCIAVNKLLICILG
ncbi:hypothetical protein Btru_004917 [Bulinus truncatus]|nr:hypothetical protein Btru_004917 [Bulinus truncatus]